MEKIKVRIPGLEGVRTAEILSRSRGRILVQTEAGKASMRLFKGRYIETCREDVKNDPLLIREVKTRLIIAEGK